MPNGTKKRNMEGLSSEEKKLRTGILLELMERVKIESYEPGIQNRQFKKISELVDLPLAAIWKYIPDIDNDERTIDEILAPFFDNSES